MSQPPRFPRVGQVPDGYDPFDVRGGAPGQGARAQGAALDPFASTTQAKARKADGQIAPRVAFQLPSDPNGIVRDGTAFTLADDVRSLYDPFSISVPNDDGRFNYLLGCRQYPIRLWHADPYVGDGIEIPALQGVVTRVQARSGPAGSTISLDGYDLGWLLTSCAPFWVDIKGRTWQSLTTKLLHRSWVQQPWGFRAIIGINPNVQIRQGRMDAEVAALNRAIRDEQRLAAQRVSAGVTEIKQFLFTNIKALTPRIQTQPGETVGDVLTRYAKFASPRCFVGVSALGDLMLWTPDYKQAPSYTFHYHVDARLRDFNNVSEVEYVLDGEPVYQEVNCVGSNIYPIINPNQDDPNEGKFAGRFTSYLPRGPRGIDSPTTPVPQFIRAMSFADMERYLRSQAYERARWRYNQGLYEGETWTATIPGRHSQNGVPFVAGTRAQVKDSKHGVDKIMFVSRVVRTTNLAGGAVSVVTCKPDGVLGP